MPTYKHPCPYCGKFIDKIAAACPYCGQADPFAPKRCLACRKIVEDPAWVVCPSCGASLIAPPPGATTAATGSAAGTPAAGAPTQAQASGTPASGSTAPQPVPAPRPPLNADAAAPVLKSAGSCSGCGAPLPAGARFCTICGTMAAG